MLGWVLLDISRYILFYHSFHIFEVRVYDSTFSTFKPGIVWMNLL